jgi:PAS domain S-box-containing protein
VNYSFSELVNLNELQSLCEEFTQLTGFVTAILDMEGNVLIATGWQEVCTRFHRSAPGTALRCRESDTILANRLLQGEEYALYRCGNGLIDIAVPIKIDGTQMGNLYSGQFLFDPPDLDFFRRQAANFGFDEASYLDAVNRIPIVTEERARNVMGFLCRLAEMIGRLGLARIKMEAADLIVKNSPTVLFQRKTCEGWPVTFVSENISQFGYTDEELSSGKIHYASIIFCEDLQRVVAKVGNYSLRGKDRFQLEYRIITKNGKLRWVEERTVAERDATNRIIHYRGTLLDITERKQAEEALRFTQFAVDNTLSQAFWSTADGRIFYVNDAACRALGYTRQELLCMSIQDIAPEINAQALADHWHELRKKGALTFETVNRRKDGSIYPVETRANHVVFDGKEYNCAFGTDISKRKQTEEALKNSEQRYRDIVENAPIGIFRSTLAGKFLAANPALARILKYDSPEELIQAINRKNVAEVIYLEPERRTPVVRKSIESHEWNVREEPFRCKDGSVVTLNFYHHIVPGTTGEAAEFEGFGENITERKRAEIALRESEARLRLALAAANQAFYDLDVRTGSARLSLEFPRMLGFEAEEYIPTIDFLREQVHPEDRERASEAYRATLEGETEIFSTEYRHRTKTGGWLWVLSQGKAVEHDGDGNALRIMGILADISERKKIEERIRASLAEKTILLKEVHHRVKNNLQIISSLLDLQSDYMRDEQDRNFFKDSQNRIRSMSLIHQKLYQSENLASIDFSDYLEDLANYLFASSTQDTGRIRLNIEVEKVLLGMDEAIPCGLIVNELISNSLQHAFPDDREGEISVRCYLDEGGITLTVSDNGIGLPTGLDFRNTETLGLQLVTLLVLQLQGQIELHGNTGTSFMIRFRGVSNE